MTEFNEKPVNLEKAKAIIDRCMMGKKCNLDKLLARLKGTFPSDKEALKFIYKYVNDEDSLMAELETQLSEEFTRVINEEYAEINSAYDSDCDLKDRIIMIADYDASPAEFGADPIPMDYAEFSDWLLHDAEGMEVFHLETVDQKFYDFYLARFNSMVQYFNCEDELCYEPNPDELEGADAITENLDVDESTMALTPVGKQFEIVISRLGDKPDIVQKSPIMDLHALESSISSMFINKAKELISRAKQRGTNLATYGVQVIKNTIRAPKKDKYNHYGENEFKLEKDSTIFSTGLNNS